MHTKVREDTWRPHSVLFAFGFLIKKHLCNTFLRNKYFGQSWNKEWTLSLQIYRLTQFSNYSASASSSSARIPGMTRSSKCSGQHQETSCRQVWVPQLSMALKMRTVPPHRRFAICGIWLTAGFRYQSIIFCKQKDRVYGMWSPIISLRVATEEKNGFAADCTVPKLAI